MNWSPQQLTFLEWAANGEGSAVVESVAGSGKTTVLIEGAKRMPGSVAVMAYNKDIGEEVKARLKAQGVPESKAKAGTVHSFGLAAIRKSSSAVIVEKDKVRNMFDGLVKKMDPAAVKLRFRSGEIFKLVSLAKQTALGIEGASSIDDEHAWHDIANHFDVIDYTRDDKPPVVEIIAMAKRLLKASNEVTKLVDFDDMVYLPVLHGLAFDQYDNVMVDEAQDTNAARRAMVRAMVRPGGRMAAFGDRHQAIYGFTGADSDALDLIKADFDAVELPMTITFRCPKTVVAFAQQWVSHIEAAPTAPEGNPVANISLEDMLKRNDLDGSAAVLCRLNKPLVQIAFELIRAGKPCKIAGRDIAKGLQTLLTKWKIADFDQLEKKLDKYLAAQTTRLLAAKQESKLAMLQDQIDTVHVVIDQCRKNGKEQVSDAVAYVDNMFSDKINGVLTLSSIHKAKGREWHNVFWLDRENTCPSKWARQTWQKGQERNLCYVAATRAMGDLIEVIVPKKEKGE